MTNKSLKRTRIINYFINAATSIIQEEGISGITIRKVADKTGYNSATLYNYFENLDQLVFLAALKCMEPYTSSLHEQIQSVSNALEKNLKVWELFCLHSFKNPEIYEAIFFAHFNKESNSEYLSEYYSFYSSNGANGDATLSDMLSHQNIYERNHIILQECATEGFFRSEDLNAIDEMSIFLYKGMLSKALLNNNNFSPEEYTKITMNYIRHCYKSFLLPEKVSYLK
nr:TetR/AcrR family transcriptional regulator [uncultured Aminipila sp.]